MRLWLGKRLVSEKSQQLQNYEEEKTGSAVNYGVCFSRDIQYTTE